MDFQAIYSFLFETYQGVGILVLAGLVISIIAAALLEVKTRRTFVDRGPREEDTDFEDQD
jgi:hypothetical protein